MAQLGAKLVLPLRPESNSSLTFDFNKLDDFHPDRIFERSELFQALRELRARLSNPKTFQQAAEEVRQRLDISEPPPPQPVSRAERQPESEARDADFSGGSLLDQVLARSSVEPSSESRPPADDVSPDLRALVQEAVRPYLLPDQSEQESLTAAIDKAIGEQMRAVFHHPDFQALEAAWRALDFLVSRVETGTELKLYLLDISREELAAAILANEAVQTTGIYKLLVDATVKTFGGERWAVLAGNYLFDFNAQDADLLRRLSIVARDAGAPFIGGATSRVVGCESLVATPEPEDWRETAVKKTSDSEVSWSRLAAILVAPPLWA
jgi:predicted component of type VI protein secretion system